MEPSSQPVDLDLSSMPERLAMPVYNIIDELNGLSSNFEVFAVLALVIAPYIKDLPQPAYEDFHRFFRKAIDSAVNTFYPENKNG